MEWAKSLMMNSCDVLLIDRINEKFDELDIYKQGGVTYIKIALDEMFYFYERLLLRMALTTSKVAAEMTRVVKVVQGEVQKTLVALPLHADTH